MWFCLGLKQRTSFTTIIVNFLKKKLDPKFSHRIDPFFSKNLLVSGSPLNVSVLDNIGTSQDTGAGNTSKDVGSSSFHQRHKTFVLDNCFGAINRTGVFNSTTTGHHHTPSDGVDWVRSQSTDNSDSPSQEETGASGTLFSEKDWSKSIVKSEVESSVDEDTNARDDESSVETLDTIGSESFLVDIEESVELSFSVGAFVVVGESGSGKVQRVDNSQRH